MLARARSAAEGARRPGDWSPSQRRKNDLLFAAAEVATAIGLRLPRSSLGAVGAALGLTTYLVLHRERARAEAHVALAFPGLSRKARRALTRRIFVQLGENLADTLALLDPDERPGRTLALSARSRAVLGAALARGRGVVYATCHLGPWERMAALLSAEGFPITAVARESYDPRFHAAIYDRLRAKRGVEVVYRGSSTVALQILRALRQGRVTGFLVDLPGRAASQPVRWLGRASYMPVGPARIALRTGAPVVIGTPAPRVEHRVADDAAGGAAALTVDIEPLPTSDLRPCAASEAILCQRIADALSVRIRALPEHWPWMHPSWAREPIVGA